MTEPAEDLKQSPTLAVLVELARRGVHEPSREDIERGLVGLRSRLDASRVRDRRLRWTVLAAVLAIAPLLGLAGMRWLDGTSQVLTYHVEGGRVLDGGYLHQDSGGAGVTLVFSEGTRFAFEPGTRGRLRAIDEAGARVGLEKGSAHFEVTPNRGLRWVVEVGPFAVAVKGTAFDVTWDPSSECFDLDLRHGQVSVSGPVANGTLELTAGQHLFVDVPKAKTLITSAKTPATADTTAVSPPEVHPTDDVPVLDDAPVPGSNDEANNGEAHSPTITAPLTGRSRSSSKSEWSTAMAHGKWGVVLADVDRAGIEATLTSASSEELAIIADAARYSRRSSLAKLALQEQRQRYPNSRRARDAAFLLGRVAETQGNPKQALEWYDTYLSQSSNGAYAAEALIRKMALVNKTSGPAQAQPIAREYLRRFPNGKHAGSARALDVER